MNPPLESPQSHSLAALVAWARPAPARLLIVDDNPSIHRDFDLVLKDELRNEDLEAQEHRLYQERAPIPVSKPVYHLDHAFSGLEGIEKISQALAANSPYQLAFVDIRMPGIDGVETIERLWKLDPRVQIVICTAFADYSWDDLAERLGPTENLLVLKKPFDSIEVTQLASTLTQKWFLAQQAALKLEEMERLVARRTEKLLKLQRGEGGAEPRADGTAETPEGETRFDGPKDASPCGSEETPPIEKPVALVAGSGGVRQFQPSSTTEEITPSQVDMLLLRRAIDTIEKHLSDYEFDVDALAHRLAMSRRQLFRKLKAVTGDTPHTLIRNLRLNRAAQLLSNSTMTVTEITYAVGFSDLKHFRELFREHFGVLPGVYPHHNALKKAPNE